MAVFEFKCISGYVALFEMCQNCEFHNPRKSQLSSSPLARHGSN